MAYTERQFEEHIEASLQQAGWQSRPHTAYDRALCQLPDELLGFIRESQPKEYRKLQDQYGPETDQKLCKRIQDEIARYGLIHVLRGEVKDRGCTFKLVYFEPRSGLNPDHAELHRHNRFQVVRQVHYSLPEEKKSIDMVYFLNGLPILTMELKNQLTGQTILDAEKQYRNDRNPKEPLLQFKRCLAHFCVDNDRVSMTTRLGEGKTRFLPYNKGIDNPVHPSGHRTTYLWEEVLHYSSILDILENFVFIAEEKEKAWDPKQGRVEDVKKQTLVFPRYHQLDVIRQLRQSVKAEGVGSNYLIQHTTGAGKSYSIGWLAFLLSSLYRNREDTDRLFSSVIVVTDRRVLDKQLRDTITQLERTVGVVNPVDKTSQQLKEYLEKGKDIIVTTIQKFPVISQTIAKLPGERFAVIVDEVHSSQSGQAARHLKRTLHIAPEDEAADRQEDDEYEDLDAQVLEEMVKFQRKGHVSFFGFTGTPKNKTLEVFGRKNAEGVFVPFHSYSMRQSIAEGFTLDVLKNYTTYKRYFKLLKEVADDKEVPINAATRALLHYVDEHPETVSKKVNIILRHFRDKTAREINGKARAMVVTRSRLHCVLYYQEMRRQMEEQHLPYSCLVAFTGTVKHRGIDYTETGLNNLGKGVDIPEALKDPRYRILIVANKFQTGFDEPLLHAMFVDKQLSGLQCVQTLSRLNRTTSGKTGAFVLDFVNDPEEVQKSFQPYFQTTVLEGETDPNKLYALETEIRGFHLILPDDIREFCEIFYDHSRPQELLQPILNRVADRWSAQPEEEEREGFRSLIQSYIRQYGYLSQIITFLDLDLEKLYVFLQYLNKKLPRRKGPLLPDITTAVDLDSLRIQKNFEGAIPLEAEEGKVYPPSEGKITVPAEPEKDFLSEIIATLNESFGKDLSEEDKVDLQHIQKRLSEDAELKKAMAADNSESNQRKKFDEVLMQILLSYVNDRFEFYKKMEDPKVKEYVGGVLWRGYREGGRL